MPSLDVIIPAYNAAHFLPTALDSVVSQTFKDWRIILVDDGSHDATAEIAAAYQARLADKIQYIRQENAGVSAARNNAIRHSKAEFLAMLDADDVWLPRRLEQSLKVFEKRPEVALTYGFNDRIDLEGRVIDTFANRNRHAEGFVAPYLYTRQLDIPCLTVTLRRSCLQEVGLFDESLAISEDRDLWLRIAARFEVALVPEVIAQYRVSSNSATGNMQKVWDAQLRFIAKHYKEPGCGWWARRVALANIYRQRAEAFKLRGKQSDAARNALLALVYNPLQVKNLRSAVSIIAK